MAQAAAARLLSTEDAVLKILHRVSTDRAALFRCAAACKRWHALVADRSFLRRCWPDKTIGGPSALLGFFSRQCVNIDVRYSSRLFLVPPPEGSVLGPERRLLTSMVDGVLDDNSHHLEPLAARHGLLVVHLVTRFRHCEPVHLAICDPVAHTASRLLPPLERTASFISCTILTGAECRQHHRPLDYFKVLAVVFSDNLSTDDQECNLYTFSSSESQWSAPTKCFHEIHRRHGKHGGCFVIPPQTSNVSNVLCGATVHWLVQYYFGHGEETTKYYTLDVSAETHHASSTEIPIPASQLTTKYFKSSPTLGVTADGSLSLFCMNGNEARMCNVNVWKRGNDAADNQVWIHTRAIELKNLPILLPKHFCGVRMLHLEKSDTLLIIDESRFMRKINVETGVVEEKTLQNVRSFSAVPMNMDWPTWFATRLGKRLESKI